VTYRAVVATSFNDPSSRVWIERRGRMIELSAIDDRGGGGDSVSVYVRESDNSKWSVVLDCPSLEAASYRSVGRNDDAEGVVPEIESIVLDIDDAISQLQLKA
jgi:hypothetical protein